MNQPTKQVPQTARRLRTFALVLAAGALGWILRAALAPAPGSAGGPVQAQVDPAPAAVWTCSMHTQVRRAAFGSCPICSMDLVLVEQDASAAGGRRRLGMSAAARALADIRTRRVERRPVEAEVRMVGRIEVDETRLSDITAWFGGRIERMFVDSTGVAVNAGDHLVELYSPELYSAQEELLQSLRAASDIEAEGSASARLAGETLAAARERLRQWGLTEAQVAAVEQRGSASDRVTIYAPQSGVVIHRGAQLGMYVETGTHIYTLADLSHVWVLLEAYESDLAWLRYGQSVEFSVPAAPGETFEGTIAFIDPVLDPRTRTVRVRVNVDNSGRKLKPQMFVSARVRARFTPGGQVIDEKLAGKWICPMHPEVVRTDRRDCDVCGMDLVTPESLGYATTELADARPPLVVPASAVLLTGRRAIVYVELDEGEEPVFEGREVVLGPRAGEHYVVVRGLAQGERVVVHGNFKIDSALQLQARPSMMLPDGGGIALGPQEVSAEAARALGRIEDLASALEVVLASEDVDATREVFDALQAAVDALEPAQFTGQGAAVWRELAMVLGNDAAEGAGAHDIEDARRAAGLLRGRMLRLRAAFGHQAGIPATPAFVTPPEFAQLALELWPAYARLRDALVADELEPARAALAELERTRASLAVIGLEGEAQRAWSSHDANLAQATAHGAADVAELRVHLQPISAAMAGLLESFGIGPDDILELNCPMAFDGQGGTWLQTEREVSNPYFGDSMLRCGSVQRTLTRAPATHGEQHDH